MAREHRYSAQLIWTGASRGPTASYESYSREYEVRIAEKPPLKGSADPTFRGDPALHNPEDLLVAALSACHMLTYLAVCARGGVAVLSYEDEADGTMVLERGGGHFVEVVLRPRVRVTAGSDLAVARAAHEEAHRQCFIASSVNFPVRHEASVEAAR